MLTQQNLIDQASTRELIGSVLLAVGAAVAISALIGLVLVAVAAFDKKGSL